MISYYNTIDDIPAECDTAILPLGSIEQHSSHLPTGTDYFIVKATSERLAERINAYLLPPLPISTCYEHTGKKGSVCMRPSTFALMFGDILTNLKNQGFKKVIVMIGHGGIFAADPVIREMNCMNDDFRVIKLYGMRNEKITSLIEGDPNNEIHAGEKETSLMLYVEEGTVKKDKMAENDFVPDRPREYLNYLSLLKLSKTGAWGYPSFATREKGEKLMEYIVDAMVEYVNDAFEYATKDRW